MAPSREKSRRGPPNRPWHSVGLTIPRIVRHHPTTDCGSAAFGEPQRLSWPWHHREEAWPRCGTPFGIRGYGRGLKRIVAVRSQGAPATLGFDVRTLLGPDPKRATPKLARWVGMDTTVAVVVDFLPVALNRPSRNAPQTLSCRVASRDSGFIRHFRNQRIACQDRSAGPSLVIPIEADRN